MLLLLITKIHVAVSETLDLDYDVFEILLKYIIVHFTILSNTIK